MPTVQHQKFDPVDQSMPIDRFMHSDRSTIDVDGSMVYLESGVVFFFIIQDVCT